MEKTEAGLQLRPLYPKNVTGNTTLVMRYWADHDAKPDAVSEKGEDIVEADTDAGDDDRAESSGDEDHTSSQRLTVLVDHVDGGRQRHGERCRLTWWRSRRTAADLTRCWAHVDCSSGWLVLLLTPTRRLRLLRLTLKIHSPIRPNRRRITRVSVN